MDRRTFIAVVTGILATPLVAEPQQSNKVCRIGFLRRTSPEPTAFEAFRTGLRELGYVEGQNVVIEQRYANGVHERLPGLARELLEIKVDVFVVDGTLTVRAIRKVAATTPVVFTLVCDPVRDGLVSTLARSGGTMTGMTQANTELTPKRLQLLREIVPAGRVGVLYNPSNMPAALAKPLKDAATSLGVELKFVEARRPDGLVGAFSSLRQENVRGVLVAGDAMFYSQRAHIVDLAVQYRLPALYEDLGFAEAGGLITYGPNQVANFRHAAVFVDKIFKGAKPADLPVEQPTKFALVINLKTAKALGLTIPQSLLARADEVIQ
jgi:putative ABC transport system substrate-binding protein